MWQIVANLEFVTGFAIDLQTRKPNISPRVIYCMYVLQTRKHCHVSKCEKLGNILLETLDTSQEFLNIV